MFTVIFAIPRTAGWVASDGDARGSDTKSPARARSTPASVSGDYAGSATARARRKSSARRPAGPTPAARGLSRTGGAIGRRRSFVGWKGVASEVEADGPQWPRRRALVIRRPRRGGRGDARAALRIRADAPPKTSSVLGTYKPGDQVQARLQADRPRLPPQADGGDRRPRRRHLRSLQRRRRPRGARSDPPRDAVRSRTRKLW